MMSRTLVYLENGYSSPLYADVVGFFFNGEVLVLLMCAFAGLYNHHIFPPASCTFLTRLHISCSFFTLVLKLSA